MRILIVEDEARLAQIIARVLEQEGYETDVAEDGDEGLDRALTGAYDGLIIDRMLPGHDGLEIVRALRAERRSTPALLLTAKGDLPDRVEGLSAGADDYLAKPFAFEELLARLRAILRRGERPLVAEEARIGDLTVNLTSRQVRRGEEDIALTPREFALLEMLVRHRGRVLTRDQILERVWGYDADPQGNAVELYVHYLRRKLRPAEGPSPIRTVRGVGYTLRADA
jgi:DNA-binding response OmpR family regulator